MPVGMIPVICRHKQDVGIPNVSRYELVQTKAAWWRLQRPLCLTTVQESRSQHSQSSVLTSFACCIRLLYLVFRMASLYLLSAVLLALGLLFLKQRSAFNLFGKSNLSEPPEPPIATATIPIVGHLIGLSRQKFNYYINLR